MSKSSREQRAARAAEQLAAQKKAERKRTILAVGGVVVAMAIIIGGGVWLGLRGSSDDSSSSSTTTSAASSYGVSIGQKSAPHKVVIYEDFLCPYCDAFENTSRDDLTKLADAGKVYVDYRPFQLLSPDYSAEALNAFAVVRQAYPTGDVAKKFHDLLYENQPSETGPFPELSSLVDLAVKAGADKSKVEKGILDTSSQSDWVDGANQEAQKAGVQGTPTIYLDGKIYQKGGSVEEMAQNLVKDLS